MPSVERKKREAHRNVVHIHRNEEQVNLQQQLVTDLEKSIMRELSRACNINEEWIRKNLPKKYNALSDEEVRQVLVKMRKDGQIIRYAVNNRVLLASVITQK